MKAEIQAGDQVIELDTSEMEERINKNVNTRMESYKAELKNWQQERKESRGKGIVEALKPNRKKEIIENLKDHKVVAEQWTIAIPSLTKYETAAHLRDYVFVTDVIKGKQGDTVNIPYVKDLDFETLAAVGNAFAAETTGLISTYTTTLKEAGAWSDIEYFNIEKINSNLLDELNRVFAHAAVRAEDKELIKLLDAGTTSDFAVDALYGDTTVALIDTHFKAEWIADAIGALLTAGKEVHPGDCVLYMTPIAYASLLKELASSQAVSYVRSDVMTKGMVEDYLGVHIVVGGYETKNLIDAFDLNDTSYQVCYLFRAKRCLALAPKRDILIETDRQIHVRELRITGSHTFGVKLLDLGEAVRILTGQPCLV